MFFNLSKYNVCFSNIKKAEHISMNLKEIYKVILYPSKKVTPEPMNMQRISYQIAKNCNKSIKHITYSTHRKSVYKCIFVNNGDACN